MWWTYWLIDGLPCTFWYMVHGCGNFIPQEVPFLNTQHWALLPKIAHNLGYISKCPILVPFGHPEKGLSVKVRKLLNCAQFICLKAHNSKANVSATNQICRGLIFHCAQVVMVNGVVGKSVEGTIWGAADTTSCSKSVQFWLLPTYNLKLWLASQLFSRSDL